ncbi:LOG family protein [Caulobacter segnis]
MVLPGGIGTLEEIVELLSWRRLDLHQKPIVFHNPGRFLGPTLRLIHHTIERGLTPPSWPTPGGRSKEPQDVTPALLAWDEEIYRPALRPRFEG